jgi:uncharacterized protein (DUF2164 family)
MWIYFIERNNTKVVIPSDQLLLDATRETQKELERFNIRYTLTYTHINEPEYAIQAWRKSGYRVVNIEWLAKAVAGWHCKIEEKPKAQPLPRYEDIFNKQKKRKPKRNIEEENKSPPKPPKPLPHQRWVWGKKNFAEGTVEMIIEEVLRRGLFVEFITSELGQWLANYYGEALRDLVRRKIREL